MPDLEHGQEPAGRASLVAPVRPDPAREQLPPEQAALQRLSATAGNAAVVSLLGKGPSVQRCGGEKHEGCAECGG